MDKGVQLHSMEESYAVISRDKVLHFLQPLLDLEGPTGNRDNFDFCFPWPTFTTV